MTVYQVDHLPMPTSKVVGLDIETTQNIKETSSPFSDRIVTIQISDGKDAWVTLGNFESVLPLLANPDIIKVIHNASFDLGFLFHQLGAKIDRASLWDSLIVERVCNAGLDTDNSLAGVAARRCGIMLDKTTRSSFAEHEGELSREQLDYVVKDVLYLPQIYHSQCEEANKKMLGRVIGVENRIVPLVTRMSLHGIRYDQDLWRQYVPQIRDMLTLIQNRIGEVADLPRETDLFGESKANINLNSTQQVQAMFESLGFTVTLKGEKTTNKIALAAFLDANPGFKYASVIEDVITWRQWSHMVSGAYAKEVQSDGKIHCQWNQVEADTGRFSCSKPNLQNVERPRPERPNLRHLFLPEDDDHTFLIADYNQQEPRVFAQISGDVNLRRACSESDVYIGMVKQIFGIDVKKGDKKRDDAKTGVLADLYGAQPATLASRLKCSMAEAEAFHAKITEQFRDARRWSTRTIDSAKNTGQVRTLLGRIRYFPEAQIYKKISPHLANQFVNTPIQGSGADMLKLALDKFGAVCEEHDYPAYPSMVVHDEIVVQCRKDFAEEVYYQLVGSMEEAGSELCPDVKIIADGTISPRWDKT